MRKTAEERKKAVIAKLADPHGGTVAQIAKETGVSPATVYAWRREARQAGIIPAPDDSTPEGWTSADKFRAVLACAPLNEEQTAEYCRRNGLYPEQVRRWREACEQANAFDPVRARAVERELREKSREVRLLAKDVLRKDKALAETTALLVLAKKARAILGEGDA